jgi:anti-anti-sigma factor
VLDLDRAFHGLYLREARPRAPRNDGWSKAGNHARSPRTKQGKVDCLARVVSLIRSAASNFFHGRYNMSTTSYKLAGRLDGASSASHEKALQSLLVGDADSIDIDLSELDYVSSAGLRVLLVAAKAAKAKGGKVTLLSPKPSTLEVLKISGFDKIIAIQA